MMQSRCPEIYVGMSGPKAFLTALPVANMGPYRGGTEQGVIYPCASAVNRSSRGGHEDYGDGKRNGDGDVDGDGKGDGDGDGKGDARAQGAPSAPTVAAGAADAQQAGVARADEGRATARAMARMGRGAIEAHRGDKSGKLTPSSMRDSPTLMGPEHATGSLPAAEMSVDGSRGSGGRVGGKNLESPSPMSSKVGHHGNREEDGAALRGRGGGRLRFKWGVDVELEVPSALEALVKGPWDPKGDMWRKQADWAVQVIRRSGGVVFLEQLAPLLNPRAGPPRIGQDGIGASVVADDAVVDVVRLLSEFEGVPEVTSDGDILYIFPGLSRSRLKNDLHSRSSGGEGSANTRRGYEDIFARPDVIQFEEVPRLFESLPKISEEGPKVIAAFFERTALSGLALFLSLCLLLGQVIFGAWPAWFVLGPAYLTWVSVDDSLKRSRRAAAQSRDRWRGDWAERCRGDEDVVWRKRAAARARAKRLTTDGV